MLGSTESHPTGFWLRLRQAPPRCEMLRLEQVSKLDSRASPELRKRGGGGVGDASALRALTGAFRWFASIYRSALVSLSHYMADNTECISILKSLADGTRWRIV